MNEMKLAVSRMRPFLVATCAILMLISSGQLFAQAGIDTGSVTGTVKDPSGALVVGATCTLTNAETGVAQTTASTSAGAYAFPIVQVGAYTLKVGAKGFQGSVIDRVIVHLGSTNTQDVRLKVGAASAEVTVVSSAPLLQAQDASLGTTIDSTTANELPLFGGSGGRSFMDLITTTAGVQYTGNSDSTGTFLIHGVQSGAVDVRVNGADDNAEVFGGITIPPIPDAIQEMKVETGNNDADLGHSYGTVVNVTTKQGTNKLQGSVWEYDENDMFNANDYFNKRTQMLGGHPNRPGRFKENEPGFIVGGPVVIPHIYDGHNKTFFTVDYQYTHYVATPSYTGTIPTATMQSSNFTNLVDTLNQSTTKYLDGAGRTFQAGTIMDPSTTRAVPCGSTDTITGLPTNCSAKGVVGVITDPNVNSGVQSAVLRDPYFHELGQPAGCPSLVGTTNWVTTIAGGAIAPSCFNQLPGNRIDPNAVKLLQLFPSGPKYYNNAGINPNTGLSNAGTRSYSNNFFELLPQVVNTEQYDVRLDHTFTDKDSSYLTFSHYNQTNQEQPPYAGPLEGGSSVSFWSTNPTYMVVLTETHVFNPHLINEFRASDEHNWNTREDPNGIDNNTANGGYPAQFGIGGIPETTNNGGLPTFSIGSSISSFGSRTNVTWQKVGAWQFSDSVTKIVGRHEWKFGAEYWWTYGNIAQLPYSKGNFSFGQFSNVPASGDGGPSMTDFLLEPSANVGTTSYLAAGGLSTSTNEIGGVNGYNGNNWNKSTYHAPYIAFYAVDNWKITPDLTVNLGIRDDYFGPYYSNGGTGSEGNFWMGGNGNEASGSAYHIAHDGCNVTMSSYFKGLLAYNNIPIICEPNNAANTMPMFNFAPRLGIEYRIRPNLVVRAGGGVSYGAFNSIGYGGTLGTNYPFRVAVQNGPQYSYRPQSVSNAGTGATTPTIESLFNIVSMTNAANAYQPLGSVVLYGKPYNFKIPYTESLNFAVQWQFTSHDSIEARYVGNLGRQLESADPYHNAPRQALTPSTAAVNVPSIFAQQSQTCYPNCYAATSPLMPDGSFTIPFPNMAANEGPIENTEQISNYNAGEVEYQHQFGGGFDMDANYTYAGCLSDAQGGQQNEGGPANGRAPWLVGFGGYRADYDRCENMAAQVFNLRGIYDLPFGRGSLLLPNANGLVDSIVGGWKLIPTWTSQSGFRANFSCQGTIGGVPNAAGQFTGPWFQTSNTAWACDAPLVKGVNPYKPGPNDQARSKVTGFWNSTAFTAPANAVSLNGQQDFSPWGVRGDQVYGPGWYDVDLSARKSFRVTEATKVELIANAINAFNHVHLSNPATSNYTQPQNETLTAGFGTITGDASNNGSGRIWEFAAKYDF